jgi:hypothetical protein
LLKINDDFAFDELLFQLSFLFMDGDENLLIDSAQTFAQQLGCDIKAEVKWRESWQPS